MRFSTERVEAPDGAGDRALDWASLGRLVRSRTLEAVAMHFATVELDQMSEGEGSRGLKPAAQVG